jgi:hypothetical protein
MSDFQKRVLGSVLSAAFSAGVAYLAPEYQGAALALFASAMTALHIPRPGDSNTARTAAKVQVETIAAMQPSKTPSSEVM